MAAQAFTWRPRKISGGNSPEYTEGVGWHTATGHPIDLEREGYRLWKILELSRREVLAEVGEAHLWRVMRPVIAAGLDAPGDYWLGIALDWVDDSPLLGEMHARLQRLATTGPTQRIRHRARALARSGPDSG